VPLAFLAPVQLPMIPYLDYAPPTAFAQGPANVDVLTSVTAAANMPRSGESFVGIIWLTGVIAYIALVAVQTTRAYVRWSKIRLSTNPSLLGLLEDCKLEAGVTAPIGLVVSNAVSSPAILGWLRPRILLPQRLATDASSEELRPIILHELAHFRAFDVPFNWLLMLVRSVHWFNPIAHLGAGAWTLFREEAADEEAVKWMKDCSGQAYGDALMRSLRNIQAAVPPFGAFGIVESVGLLKRRITLINQFRNKAPRLAAVGTISIFLVAVVCSISANDPQPESADSMTVVNAAAKEWLSEVDRGEVERSRKEASDSQLSDQNPLISS
jgi:beta-lactamase regulating signal transducer with metallopeptidase domain